MPEFFNVLPPEQALKILLDRLPPAGAGGGEHVAISEALGRITDCHVAHYFRISLEERGRTPV